jgi:hypothetical protein
LVLPGIEIEFLALAARQAAWQHFLDAFDIGLGAPGDLPDRAGLLRGDHLPIEAVHQVVEGVAHMIGAAHLTGI